MVSETTLELINVAIDEEATPSERAELAQILGQSDNALREFEALSTVNGLLKTAAAAEAPSVHDAVMGELRRRVAQPRSSTIIPAGGRFSRRRIVFLGWAAAAAVVLGFAVAPFVGSRDGGPPVPTTGVSGAMAPMHVDDWPAIADARSGSGLSAMIRRQNNRLAVIVAVAGPADVTVAWPAGKLALADPAATGQPAAAERTIHCAEKDCPVVLLQYAAKSPAEITVSVRNGEQQVRLGVEAP